MTRNATRVVTLLVATLLASTMSVLAGAPQNWDLTYDVSQGTYNAISGGTVHASSGSIEDYSTYVDLPFSINWNGNSYDALYIDGDGFVTFTWSDAVHQPKGDNSQGKGGPYGGEVIMAWHNQLSGGVNAQLRSQTLGSTGQRTFVVQWGNVTRAPAGSSNDNLNFQIRINESTQSVDVVYGSMTLGGAMGAMIGVGSDNTGSLTLVSRYDQADWMYPHVSGDYVESIGLEGFAPSSGLTYSFRSLYNVDASVIDLYSPSSNFSAGTPQVIKVVVRNWGNNDLDSVMIRWSINGVNQTPVMFYPQPALETGEEMIVQLGTRTFNAGSFNTLRVWTTLPNGATDGAPGNDQHMAYLAPLVEGRLNIALGGPNNVFPSFRDCFRHLAVSGISGDVNVWVYGGEYNEQILVPDVFGAGTNGDLTVMAAPGEEPIATWRPSNHPYGDYGAYESDYTQVFIHEDANVAFQDIEFRLPNNIAAGGHFLGENVDMLHINMCTLNGPTNYASIDTPDWSVEVRGGETKVTDSDVNRMLYGIRAEAYGNNKVTITGNTIQNVTEGIDAMSYDMNVSWNTVKGEISANDFVGIAVQGAGMVAGNKVNAVDAGRDGYMAFGIDAESYGSFNTPKNGLTIHNNFVAIDGYFYVIGIDTYASTYNNAATKVYHNSVNLKGQIIDGVEQPKGDKAQGGAYYSAAAGRFTGNTRINSLNNIWHAFGNGTDDGGLAVAWENTQATVGLVDFSNLMTTGRYVGYANGSLYQRDAGAQPLATWRNATGVDLNSSSVAVNFVGGEDLHLNEINNKLFGTSTIMAEISTDIDGEDRVVPYMGADEVRPTAIIVQQPESRYACLGESFQLLCIADVTQGATVTYQWYRDGVELTGRTGAILNFGSVGYAASGVYTCVIKVTDGFTEIEVVSDPATIIVVRPTNITLQPKSQPVGPGTTVILEVSAEAIGAPTDFVPSYQWKKRYWNPGTVSYVDSNVVDNDRITGSNSSRLTIRDIMNVDTLDQYVCEVTGYCGVATSKPAKLFMPVVAATSTTPIACEGGTISVEVAVLPSTIPGSTTQYQWYFNGAAVQNGPNTSGATGKVLTIDNATQANAGDYYCDVMYSGTGTGLTSNLVTVTIGAPPTIATEPEGDTVCAGEDVTLSIAAEGEGLSYQWTKGTTPIPNAKSATLELLATTAADAGTYSVTVVNACGEVTSANVDVVVNTAPTITTEPSDVAVFDGDEIKLEVQTDGSDPKTYQWYKGGTEITGATEATFVIDSAVGDDAGQYYCIVTNECGADTSLTVVADVTVGVAGGEILPGGYVLEFATPNPTSDVVRFNYTLPASQNVRLMLTDNVGRQIAVLVDGWVDAGTHNVEISAQSLGLAQGVYVYTFEANNTVAARQFVVVR